MGQPKFSAYGFNHAAKFINSTGGGCGYYKLHHPDVMLRQKSSGGVADGQELWLWWMGIYLAHVYRTIYRYSAANWITHVMLYFIVSLSWRTSSGICESNKFLVCVNHLSIYYFYYVWMILRWQRPPKCSSTLIWSPNTLRLQRSEINFSLLNGDWIYIYINTRMRDCVVGELCKCFYKPYKICAASAQRV